MRRLSIIPILFVLHALSALCQVEEAATTPPAPVSLELRGGATDDNLLVTFEGRYSLLDIFSIDAGLRPYPQGFYGGVSYYPLYPLFAQVQTGYMRLEDVLIDGPTFDSDLYGAFRTGVLLGKNSGLRFSAAVGGMMYVDFDYCENCGFVDPETFTPRYRDEVRWTPTIEFGIGTTL